MSLPGGVPAEHQDPPRPFGTAPAEWFDTAHESEGIPYYLTILRSHIWLLIATVAVCVGAAILYLAQAEKQYVANSDLLVTPVSRDSDTLIGLGLIRETSDPTRDVETVSRLIETIAVARRVVDRLDLDISPQQVLAQVSATPVAQSNIVTITAHANDPELAAQIANAFAAASVDYRTDRLHAQLDVLIPRLRRQIARLSADDQVGRQTLAQQLAALEELRALKDPTLRFETTAEPQFAPVSPRPVLSVAAAIVAGLIIGTAAALGSQLLDPRLRREEQLRRYRIPILARIPVERNVSNATRKLPLVPKSVSHATHDGYLLLGATLTAADAVQGHSRTVLVTGPSSGDGKTTTALNLAAAIAEMHRVILVEADSRRPTLSRAYGLTPPRGVANVLARRTSLDEALVTVDAESRRLQALVQQPGEPPLSAVMTAASADWLIRQAHLRDSWLIVDAPPLAMVPDALPLAKQVDDVILVVRLGNARVKALEELAELLVQQGITPTGFVVVGGKSSTSYYGA